MTTTSGQPNVSSGSPRPAPEGRRLGSPVAGLPSSLACHEAAHACIGLALGRRVISMTLNPPRTRMDMSRSGRDETEAAIVSLLAGAIAEDLAAMTSGYDEALMSAEEETLLLATELAEMSPRHRELLEAAAPSPDVYVVLSDHTLALALATELAGQEARLLVAWLGAVASRLVHELWPAIVRVATVLEQRGLTDGRRRRPDPI